MTTFLYYTVRQGLEFLSYESEAEGTLEKIEAEFMFSGIKIKPKILIKKDCDIQKIEDTIKLSGEHCLISNSIKSKIEIMPEIKIEM